MKIKSIELDSFRGYKEKQMFDFKLSDNEVANLVVIYAPNGFGKTSFFDAFEWLFSGQIKRITNNSKVKKIAEEEKGHILKNNDSDSKQGIIRLQTDQNLVLEAKTPLLGSFGRQTDYNKPDITEGNEWFDQFDGELFVLKNILTHDRIDTFLRFQSAKERYQALSVFWDNHGDSKLYQEIVSLSKDTERKRDLMHLRLKELYDELENLGPSPNVLDHINNLIRAFNGASQTEMMKIMFVNSVNSADDFDKLELKANTIIASLESGIAATKEKEHDALYLFRSYSQNYKEPLIQLDLLDTEKERIKNILLNFKLLRGKIERKDVEYGILQKNIRELVDFNYLIDNKDYFQGVEKNIVDLNIVYQKNFMRSVELAAEADQLHMQKIEISQIQVGLTNEIDQCNEKLIVYQNDLALIGSIEKYEQLKRKVKKLDRNITLREKVLSEVKLKINNSMQYLDMSLDQLTHYGPPEFTSSKLIELYKFGLETTRIIDIKKKKLVEIQNRYLFLQDLYSDVDKIKDIGAKLVFESGQPECPLCNEKHSSLAELMNKIKMKAMGLFGEIDLRNHQEQIEIEINGLEFHAKSVVSLIKQEIISGIEGFRASESTLERKLLKTRSLLNRKNRETQEMQSLALKERQLYRTHLLDISDKGINMRVKEVESFQRIYLNRIDKINGELENSIQRHQELTNQSILVSEELGKVQNALSRHGIQLNNHKFGEIYEKYSYLLEKYNLQKDERYIDEIQDRIIKIQSENNQLESELSVIDFEIKTLQLELKDLVYERVLMQKSEVEQRIDEFQTIISQYKIRYSLFSESIGNGVDDEVSYDKLTFEVENIKNNLLIYGERYGLLRQIIENINLVKSYDLTREKRKEYEHLEKNFLKICSLMEELEQIRTVGKKHIEEKLETELDVTLINNIYRMIDPHPEMTQIKFGVSYSDDDDLLLNVYTSNQTGSKQQAPILYFSSAQVNVLSLSVFLAGALESNMGIESILMDDPIQHLDGINMLAFIDLLRIIMSEMNKQVIISTHDERFFNLIKRKVDPVFFRSKFLRLESFGVVKAD